MRTVEEGRARSALLAPLLAAPMDDRMLERAEPGRQSYSLLSVAGLLIVSPLVARYITGAAAHPRPATCHGRASSQARSDKASRRGPCQVEFGRAPAALDILSKPGLRPPPVCVTSPTRLGLQNAGPVPPLPGQDDLEQAWRFSSTAPHLLVLTPKLNGIGLPGCRKTRHTSARTHKLRGSPVPASPSARRSAVGNASFYRTSKPDQHIAPSPAAAPPTQPALSTLSRGTDLPSGSRGKSGGRRGMPAAESALKSSARRAAGSKTNGSESVGNGLQRG